MKVNNCSRAQSRACKLGTGSGTAWHLSCYLLGDKTVYVDPNVACWIGIQENGTSGGPGIWAECIHSFPTSVTTQHCLHTACACIPRKQVTGPDVRGCKRKNWYILQVPLRTGNAEKYSPSFTIARTARKYFTKYQALHYSIVNVCHNEAVLSGEIKDILPCPMWYAQT